MRLFAGVIAGLAVFTVVGQAAAALLTYNYTVTNTNAEDSSGNIIPLGPSEPFGTVTGQLTYDTAATPTSTTSTSATYDLVSLTIDLGGGFVFSTNSQSVTVTDSPTADGIQLNGTINQGGFSVTFSAQLAGGTSVFGSTAPPLSLTLADFSDTNDVETTIVLGSTATVFGSVTDLTLVPLPAAAWMLGAGLVGLGALRKRRQATAAA